MDQNTTPTGDPGPTATGPGTQSQGPRVTWAEVQDTSRLSRPHDRMLTGVAAGVARHLDVDPLLVRIGFAVLSFFGGAGVLLYGALWLLVPEDGMERATVHLDARNRRLALIGALAVTAVAVLGNSWTLSWLPWPLIVIALIVWAFWSRNESNSARASGDGAPIPAHPGDVPPPPVVHRAPAAAHAPWVGTDADAVAPSAAVPAPWTLPVPEPTPAWTPQPPTSTAYAGPGYAAPGYAAPAYAGPEYGTPTPLAPRPRRPRATGPGLFWITAALIALGVGILGMADVAGASVLNSAYPALALTITAAMLIVGAFWGRATGLVALGLVLGLVTLGSTSSENWREDAPRLSPSAAVAVPESHEFRTGRMVLDLRDVEDPEALDGRTVTLAGGVGAIDVIVPDGIDLKVRAEVGGPGSLFVLGHRQDGIALEHEATDASGDSMALMTLDLDLGVGRITVRRSGSVVTAERPEPAQSGDLSRPDLDAPQGDVPSISLDPEAGAQR